jgi:hypothetical protein
VVLQNGRIVEDGAPAELARRNGPFGKMWRLQTNVPTPGALQDRLVWDSSAAEERRRLAAGGDD